MEHPLILQLDAAGQPQRWITYEDAAYYHCKDLIAWSLGEDGRIRIHGGMSRMTGQRSFLDFNTIIAVKGEVAKGHASRIPTLTNRSLFRRDQQMCAYCGDVFHVEDLTRDHIIPRSRGGKDQWVNVVTACGVCNKRKDAQTLEEAGMKLLYVPYAPNHAEHLILQNRRILADQMEFLLKQVSKHSRLLKTLNLN